MNNPCQENIEIIDSSKLHQMLEDKKDPPLIIDVRQPQEYETGHIPGSVLIPLGQLELNHPALDINKKIITYCRSGKRSLIGATLLCQRGFERVMSLKDGISGWKYELLPGPPRRVLTSQEVNSALDLLLKALEKEYKKEILYGEKAKKIETREIKDLFENLAAWEKEHFETLYQEYVDWSEKSNLPPKSLKEIRKDFGENIKSSEKSPDTDFSRIMDQLSDPVDILEKSVEEEFEAYNFYKVSSEMIKDEQLRSLLLDLAFEERTHASHLLNLIPNYAVP